MLSGRMLGAYRVLDKIGEGGMGEVYKARDTRLDRTVAIKVLPPDVASPDRLERFEQEARAASSLNHPNILTIHDVGREGDLAFFAMEWVDGGTLRQAMSAGRMPVRKILQIAQQIADGLAKAHAAGIVHRDLKPENVMVTTDGFVKIVDFGIAKLAERGTAADSLTRTRGTAPGLILGTFGYMSPEQAAGRAVDYRSDQFALGLLIYEMATATRPFERQTTAQSLAATIEAEPTPIEALNPQVPPHLAAVVARCLAKEPAERYESTRDLARDLRSIVDTPSRGTVVTAPTARRRRPLYVAAATLALVGVAAAAAAWLWRSNPTPSAPPLLAVRPFTNLSPDPGQAYFAAGMTEEIRGQLSQVASLRVLSRTAVSGADGKDAARIRDLGVTQLVDGSIRVEGSRVRISAELIDASTQQTLWSQQYDRELADMLTVQSDVAMQIAQALRANLSPGEKQRLEERATRNADAYAMYLKARPMASFDRTENLAAIGMLRKALAMDPRFAAAQAEIADRLVEMGYYDDVSYVDKGMVEAEAALRLNPSLPFTHFVMATGYTMKGMDAQARLSFLKALELDPNNTGAMLNLSILESTFGNLDQSLSWARRAFVLGGKKANGFYHVAVPLVTMRADDELDRWLQEGERRFPGFSRIQNMLAMLEVYRGKGGLAVSRVAKAVAQSPDNEEEKFMRADVAFLTRSPDLAPALDALAPGSAANTLWVPETVRLRQAYVAGQKGDASRAETLIAAAERAAREKIDRGDRTPALRVEMAAIAVLRRDHPAALDWLAKAGEAGFRDYGTLESDPILSPLGSDPKFRDVVDRMRRDVDAQRARARANGLLDFDALLAPAK